MPLFVSGAMRFDEDFPATLEDFGPLILYRLRAMTLSELAALPDVAEGFEQVIARAVRTAPDIDTFLASIKSKRYTMARCKRIAISALLQIPGTLSDELLNERGNQYLRVLGFLADSRGLLAAMASAGSAPIILRHADVQNCTVAARGSMAIDAFSTDLFGYVFRRDVHHDSQSAVKL